MEKGGGKGAWSAYKAAEMSKVYEKKGGGYEGESLYDEVGCILDTILTCFF